MTLRNLLIISILSTILFVSEQVLSFIPNIQITFLLIVLYSKTIKCYKTLIVIFIHVLLDNLFMGSFNIIYLPFVFIGYSIIPISLHFIKTNSEIKLALISIIYSIIYSFIFIIPQVIVTGVNILDYIIADIPFTIILSISSFISILWLYKPLYNKINLLINEKRT